MSETPKEIIDQLLIDTHEFVERALAVEAERDRLREALRAMVPPEYGANGGPIASATVWYECGDEAAISGNDFRRARAALAAKGAGDE